MLIFDIVIILLLIFGFIQGWKRGLITSFLHLVGTIVIFVLAFYLRGPVSAVLINYFPFMSFGGIFKDITSLNIVLYEGIAFFICVCVLVIIFNIILKFSKILNKILNATIILGLPNKLLGAILNIIRYYIIIFIILFIATLIPMSSNYVKESNLGNRIVNNTPVLSDVTKDLNNSLNDIYDMLQEIDNDEEVKKGDAEALEILLKYDIISTETARKLYEAGKLDIENFEEMISKY